MNMIEKNKILTYTNNIMNDKILKKKINFRNQKIHNYETCMDNIGNLVLPWDIFR